MLLEIKIPDKSKLSLDRPIKIEGPDGPDVPKDLLLTKEGFPFLWINPIVSDNSLVEKDQTLFEIWAHNSGQNIALVGITKALKKGKFHIHNPLYENEGYIWNEGDLLGFINPYKPRTKKFLKCENIIYFKKSHESFFNVKKVLNGEYVFSEISKNYFNDSYLFKGPLWGGGITLFLI